jgi:signal transduction histidine kinase/ActR/RegA family two-component response regulator
MKPLSSVRLRIRLIVGLLVAGLVVAGAVSAGRALDRRGEARRVQEIAEVSRDLLTELNLLRDERGSTAGLIASPGAPDVEELRYQANLRSQSTPMMQRALARLSDISPGGDLFYRTEIAQRFARLQALRQQADAAVALPAEQRPEDLHARFIAGVTDLTEALTESTARLADAMSRDDAYIARVANLGRLAWTVRAAAGDDSLRWWTADIVGRRLTPQQIEQFQTLKTRIDAPWSVLKEDAAHDGAPRAVEEAITRAERLYFDIDRKMRAEILDDLTGGRPAPLPTTASRRVNTDGLYSLMSVADAAFGAVAAHAVAQASDAKREAELALAAMAAALALGIGIIAFANAQVLEPISRITQAMKAVADGDLSHPIPDMRRPDEVGELARALDVFRANAAAKAALDEQLLASRIAREAAEASALAKARFLANMSHEIRTPLTAVIGFSDLMAEEPGLPETARTYTGHIQVAGKALLALVNDILDVSRIETGQVELHVAPCALRDVIDETLDLVRLEADRKGLDLVVRLDDGLPAWVMADAARLRQVLLNLLSNAIKFTAEGAVTVDAAWMGDGRLRVSISDAIKFTAEGAVTVDAAWMGDGRLRVSISDTGPGIAQNDQPRLFHRFSQVDGSSNRRFGGAGLGLAISKGLVELMGGEIGLESAEGSGSTFWFDIPAPATDSAANTVQGSLPEPLRRKSLRILLVDDLAVNRTLVSAILSPFELQLTLAAGGAEAVAAANRDAFDLILMDVQMPGMNGLEATRAIRGGGGASAAAPILALSADVMEHQIEAYRAAGMNDHVAKPINAAELLGKIDRWGAAGGQRPSALLWSAA